MQVKPREKNKTRLVVSPWIIGRYTQLFQTMQLNKVLSLKYRWSLYLTVFWGPSLIYFYSLVSVNSFV